MHKEVNNLALLNYMRKLVDKFHVKDFLLQ